MSNQDIMNEYHKVITENLQLKNENLRLENENGALKELVIELEKRNSLYPDHEVVNAAALYLTDREAFDEIYIEEQVCQAMIEWLKGK